LPNADPVLRPAAALTPEARLARARRRVAALKGFYIHLGVFALVLIGLLVVNSVTGGPWWVVWVFLGWGIGVLSHGLAVMGRGSRAIAAWEERKLRHYLAEADGGPPAGRFDRGQPT
jgi:2TM domain